MNTITVKKVGENSGFCREYFKSVEGKYFAKSTHPVYAERVEWFTCAGNGAEPAYPVDLNRVAFEEVRD